MGLEKFGMDMGGGPSRMDRQARLRRNRKYAAQAIEAGDPGSSSMSSEGMRDLRGNTQWAEVNDTTFMFAGPTRKTLPPAIYEVIQIDGRIGVAQKVVMTDELIDFPGSVTSRITHEISNFWNKGSAYRRLGFLHSRGYLFYGPQGTGKSMVAVQIARNAVQQGHLAFYSHEPALMTIVLSELRKIEPDRPIINIFEDVETILEKGEEHLLQYLDGAGQINKVVNIATTNYPEYLDPRIVARPRRFDQLIEIDELPREVREDYLRKKLTQFYAPTPVDEKEVALLADESEGLPFAALSELILALKCHGMALEDVLKRLFEMEETRPKIQNYREMGFGGIGRSRRREFDPDGDNGDGDDVMGDAFKRGG